MLRLHQFLDQRRAASGPVADFVAFERELRALVAAVEREAVAEELARHDLDVPQVLIEGVPHQRVLRAEQSYLCLAGEVTVARTLYRAASGARAICVLELQAGIIEGYWTPAAAELAAWTVAHLTPGESAQLLARVGGMCPSRASLDRLPRQLSQRWEADRAAGEAALRARVTVVPPAVTLGVSLDGVMVPLRDGERPRKRAEAAAAGRAVRGPAGCGEAGCGTLTLYDRAGAALRVVRLGRMPEPGKATLKQMIAAEVEAVLAAHPGLRLVGVADGAPDNWSFLEQALPGAAQVVDFYHAAEHLKRALDAAYGEGSAPATAQFEKLRHRLRDESGGVEKVIRALLHLRARFPKRQVIARELGYFRKHRRRMQYAELAGQKLPIGSGIVEAACKTLVTQRLKRSGMRWRTEGGQAILTLRGWCQSERFDHGWSLLAQTYTAEVRLPAKVVALGRPASG